MTPRRLLVVPYYYPPFPGSGNRWPAIARYLRQAGHTLTVVATAAFGQLPDDAELGVVRVPDLRSAQLLRALLRRGELPRAGGTSLQQPETALLTKVLVPDAHVASWLPAALVATQRILEREAIDCLVTSGPPESTHLLGLLLGRRRPAWIADFRDGWCFEPLRKPFPTAPQRALDRFLERRVARDADIAVGATRPIADDLERRLGARATYVPNAWDPEDEPPSRPRRVRDGVTLVHTGHFSVTSGRDPRPLFRALRTVLSEPSGRRLRLVLAGPLTPAERELIDGSGVASAVEYLGVLNRADALALQREADVLVLLTSRASSVATGKLFEYLGARRPILALAEGNEAERIVRETNTGFTVGPDDDEAIAAALRRVASGDLRRAYAPRNLERYTYPAPAESIAGLIEVAIERRFGAEDNS